MEEDNNIVNQMTALQKTKYQELQQGIISIEKMLSLELPSTEGSILMEELGKRIEMLSYTHTLTSLNEGFYNWAKGKVFEEMRQDTSLVGLKEIQLKLYIAGKMAKYEAMNERTKKAVRNLEISIESLRTMISYLGKQMNSHIG